MGNRPSDTSLELTDLFSLERVPIVDDYLMKGESRHPLPAVSTGIRSALNLSVQPQSL